MPANWYSISNADEVPSPALLVYPQRIGENVRRMLAVAGGPGRLCPHVKTHKMAEVVRMQLAAGIGRFKCATIAEAEMTARAGAGDVLLAYQPVGPNVERLRRLAAAFPQVRFSTIVDGPAAAARLAEAFSGAAAPLDVLVDLDVGMNRTGTSPGEGAATLYAQVAASRGLRAAGLHAYDGHIKDVQPDERAAHARADFAPVQELRRRLAESGLPVDRIVAGGTPTFPFHAKHADRECSPGTCLLWDAGYGSRFADLDFLHAAVLLTRVVSKPGPRRVCLDLGHKAVAPDVPQPRAVFFDLPDAAPVVHNEEHLAVDTDRAGELEVGDVLYALPWHVCPTCALHREVVVVEEGRAAGRWAVAARDRFLTV